MSLIQELGLEHLSWEQRRALQEELRAEEAADNEIPELSPEWKAEIDRRIALLKADPSRGTSWEVVYARLKAKYQK